MNGDIEALILSGEFFKGASRSSSPSRTPSPDDPGWHDEELDLTAAEQKLRDQGLDYDSDQVRRHAVKLQQQRDAGTEESIGMGPGRTGVKGVIRDRDEAVGMEREKRLREAEELRQLMERSSLGGKTYLEEEREKAVRGQKADELVEKELEREEERKDVFGLRREGRFGHLREAGMRGFLGAVEQEQKNVWVVVHLYEPSLERCYQLDETLSRLARTYPDTKFLRARASALGFASTASSFTPRKAVHRSQLRTHLEVDEDDPDSDHGSSDEKDTGDDDNVDLDMLPTLLVYRSGELIFNWVRVDWEAGEAGIEELLDKHHVLIHATDTIKGLGFTTGDDNDDFNIFWSDDEDDDHDLFAL